MRANQFIQEIENREVRRWRPDGKTAPGFCLMRSAAIQTAGHL
jgi:hypothetical protein